MTRRARSTDAVIAAVVTRTLRDTPISKLPAVLSERLTVALLDKVPRHVSQLEPDESDEAEAQALLRSMGG